MFTGTLTADLLLGDVHSLKGKRAVVRPIVAELRRRFAVSAAEVGDQELHRRALVGLATVSGDAGQVTDVLDACAAAWAAARRSRSPIVGLTRTCWPPSAGCPTAWAGWWSAATSSSSTRRRPRPALLAAVQGRELPYEASLAPAGG